MQGITKKRFCAALIIVMLFLEVVPSRATSISDVQDQIDDTQDNLDNVNSQMNQWLNEKQVVNDELEELDAQLVNILTSISICQDEIAAKEEAIAQAKIDLTAAEEDETAQYNAMKDRIKFMYEQGDTAVLQLILSAKSFADMLNKADYVEQLYNYDRKLLAEYQAVKEEVAALKTTLEEEEAELLAANYELEQEQIMLENTISTKQNTVADFNSKLASAEQKAQTYRIQLQEQTARIKQLEEEQRLAEEREREADANNSAGNDGSSTGGDESNGNNGGNNEGNSSGGNTGGSALGNQIANFACQFVGNPYKYGGTSLTTGADCSGFTQAVYRNFGYSLPRDSTSQRFVGRAVDYSNAQPGDLICYAGHVAIYIGNGRIVHASTEKTGIKYGYATYRTILGVRRIV